MAVANLKADSELNSSKPLQLMLIEDREADARLVEHALVQFPDAQFEIKCFRRLTPALKHIEQSTPDIILADLNLPDCSGLETFERLHMAQPETPLVIITAQPASQLALRAVDAGAQDYIVKGEIESVALGRMLLQAIARQRLRQRLAEHIHEVETSRTHLHNIVDLNLDAILLVGKQGEVFFANQRAEELFGQSRTELREINLGQPVLDAHHSTEITLKRPDGSYRRARMRIQATGWADNSAFMVMLSEVSQQPDKNDPGYIMGLDIVTGLFNRQMFYEQAQLILGQSREHGVTPGMLCLNLDNFRRINAAMGHACADDLLRAVGDRIKAQLRGGDVIGRFAGDEFVVLLAPLRRASDAGKVGAKILHALAAPFAMLDTDLRVTSRVGISVYPRDGNNVDSLVQHAQVASNRAKELGSGRIEFYTPELTNRSTHRFYLEQRLRKALPQQEFEVVYQPIVGVRSGRLLGAEALLRWHPPEHAPIGPAEFIPILEEAGLINEVGEWTLHTACTQAQAWRKAGHDLSISCNLSPLQFESHRLLPTIQAALEDSGLPAQALMLELTESSLMRNIEASIGVLSAMRDMGIRVAIDDFGTGFSSLNYLKRFAIDALKIDRSFIRDVNDNSSDAAITRATIDLAHNLGLRVVGEGVEETAQLQFLDLHGCDAYQGYLYSKPVAGDRITKLASTGISRIK